MKKSILLILLILGTLSFYNCNGDKDAEEMDEDITKKLQDEDTTFLGIVDWATEFPQLRAGTYTADFLLKTQKQANIFYLVTTTPVDFSTNSELIDLIMDTENIDAVTVLAKGAALKTSSSDTVLIKMDQLEQVVSYHAYALAQNPNDSILQADILYFEFKLTPRQQEATYNSTVENREVLYLAYQLDEGT